MTIAQLRCFQEVARQLSFARAAETLYISQPAVSHQIAALESELGIRLFDRTRHVVTLTSAGESLYHDTTSILDNLTLAVQRAQNAQNLFRKELRVGYSSSVQIQQLPQIYQAYRKRCPHVHIFNEELPTTQFVSAFNKSTLDVLFGTRGEFVEDAPMQYHPLYRGRMVCVLYEGHPLAKLEQLTLEMLDHEVLILLDMAHIYARMVSVQEQLRQKCPQAVWYFSSSSAHTLPMIQGHLGIAVMPDFVYTPLPGLTVRPISPAMPTEYGIFWRSGITDPKVAEFVKTACTVCGVK